MCGEYGALKHFWQESGPGGVAVEAVDTSERTVLILCIKISGNTVCQSIRVVADGRMYRHIGRFVYDQDIFVFIKNGKRHRNRDDSVGINSFQKTDPEMISGQKLFSAADPLTVPCKSFFVSFIEERMCLENPFFRRKSNTVVPCSFSVI